MAKPCVAQRAVRKTEGLEPPDCDNARHGPWAYYGTDVPITVTKRRSERHGACPTDRREGGNLASPVTERSNLLATS